MSVCQYDHFQKTQINLKAKNWMDGLLEVKKDFKEWNSNLGTNPNLEHARDMVLVSKPMFCGMGNHFGPFWEASKWPEGQELGEEAVGGQEGLQEVKF